MYIRYRNQGTLDAIELRDIRFFCVRESGGLKEEDGTEIQMYSICDASQESTAQLCNEAVESLASYLLGGEDKVFDNLKYRKDIIRISEDITLAELADYRSKAAAFKVFNALCVALEEGKNYFDLTKYDENGNLI